MTNPRFLSPKKLGILCLLLALSLASVRAADAAPTMTPPSEVAGSNDTLRALLQLQEEIHDTKLAIENNRGSSVADAAAMSNRLAAIEQSVVAQHANEVDALRSTNRLLLAVIGVFAAIGFI